jgi:hypothetical protein
MFIIVHVMEVNGNLKLYYNYMGPFQDYWGYVYGLLSFPCDYNCTPRTKQGSWVADNVLSFLPSLTPLILMPQDLSGSEMNNDYFSMKSNHTSPISAYVGAPRAVVVMVHCFCCY